jgi:hypothetical protein
MLIQICEVRDGSKWTAIDIQEGLARRGEDMRCHECHGRVVPMKEYSTGSKAHFEHVTAHRGCSTKERTFSGARSIHPDALK